MPASAVDDVYSHRVGCVNHGACSKDFVIFDCTFVRGLPCSHSFSFHRGFSVTLNQVFMLWDAYAT